ncbi:hypothetical protein ACRRTK_019328 [Alexandromys fortis]
MTRELSYLRVYRESLIFQPQVVWRETSHSAPASCCRLLWTLLDFKFCYDIEKEVPDGFTMESTLLPLQNAYAFCFQKVEGQLHE